ncbi:hypothetical protein F3Y22_tig00110348pilonHSYRG00182 [Hibiscus syriacus]|uniref:Uncharacterized protein n=1 Tax=Hibiscus syriacus TaxID=106335 RepID=A0A6A3AV90_HIBSY|nr:hypothetical protein F3Y22_tig00110348pilonHSYRG00182 [Hibiscus syriacus]
MFFSFVATATTSLVPVETNLCFRFPAVQNSKSIFVPLFRSQGNIAGKISVEPLKGKKNEHNGVKVELLCQIGRYVLKVTVSRNYGGSIVEYQDVMVKSTHFNSFLFDFFFRIVLKSAHEALGEARRLEKSLRPPRRRRVHEAAIQSSEAARGDEAMLLAIHVQ